MRQTLIDKCEQVMELCHWPFQEKKIDTKKVFADLLMFYNDGDGEALAAQSATA
jgi:hypothetical protein